MRLDCFRRRAACHRAAASCFLSRGGILIRGRTASPRPLLAGAGRFLPSAALSLSPAPTPRRPLRRARFRHPVRPGIASRDCPDRAVAIFDRPLVCRPLIDRPLGLSLNRIVSRCCWPIADRREALSCPWSCRRRAFSSCRGYRPRAMANPASHRHLDRRRHRPAGWDTRGRLRHFDRGRHPAAGACRWAGRNFCADPVARTVRRRSVGPRIAGRLVPTLCQAAFFHRASCLAAERTCLGRPLACPLFLCRQHFRPSLRPPRLLVWLTVGRYAACFSPSVIFSSPAPGC